MFKTPFKSHILDECPSKLEYKNLGMFIFPNGIFLQKNVTCPISYNLILTQENAERKYVTCLIFQEPYTDLNYVIFNKFRWPKKLFIKVKPFVWWAIFLFWKKLKKFWNNCIGYLWVNKLNLLNIKFRVFWISKCKYINLDLSKTMPCYLILVIAR